ncbi:MAG TPA: hypothetical protein VHP11_05810 [Tepidisphaeraceae bacterium]|nr:hypothetical protein [Tepidisphaeraceae bacterium]
MGIPSWLNDVVYPVFRWLHIVCTTLIVGGTLFFELVLPIAIEDLKREQQLYVMARARWVFRWVVYISVVGLLLSGGANLYRMWRPYQSPEYIRNMISAWAIAHMATGAVALFIALLLSVGRRPPEDPVRWMRLNLVILLVAIFLGNATRHFQLALREPEMQSREGVQRPEGTPPILDNLDGAASTQPATTRATAQ